METETTPLQRVRVFDAFRHRDFRVLWSGQVVSLIGDAAFFTALGWRAFTLVGSSRLGIVFLAQGIGLLTTLLIGGALADRIPRRTMMIASDLARFAVVGVLAVFDATGNLTFELLLVLTFLNGLGDGFFFPAVGGIVPLVVEQAALPSANSLIGVARWGSFIVGPALAASLYSATGSAVVFALDAASFVASAALLWFVRPRAVEPEAKEGTVREIAAGVRYVAGIPWLWVTIALFAVILMLQLAPQQVLMPELVSDHFGRGVGAYGLLTTAFGVGTVTGGARLRPVAAAPAARSRQLRVLAREQPRDRGPRALAVVRARGVLRARARLLRRLRRRDVGDDAAGARAGAPALARREPRLLRLVRADAGRPRVRGRDRRPRVGRARSSPAARSSPRR